MVAITLSEICMAYQRRGGGVWEEEGESSCGQPFEWTEKKIKDDSILLLLILSFARVFIVVVLSFWQSALLGVKQLNQ